MDRLCSIVKNGLSNGLVASAYKLTPCALADMEFGIRRKFLRQYVARHPESWGRLLAAHGPPEDICVLRKAMPSPLLRRVAETTSMASFVGSGCIGALGIVAYLDLPSIYGACFAASGGLGVLSSTAYYFASESERVWIGLSACVQEYERFEQ